MKKTYSYWIFRYSSNRGSDNRIAVKLRFGIKEKEALEFAKEWAARSTAGSACCEYTVTVRRIQKPPLRKDWSREWTARCKTLERAKNRYDNWRAIGTIMDWSNHL